MTTKSYKMIRGKIAEDRCTNKGDYGSPLYCECGCQTPRSTDPDLNLEGVTVLRKAPYGYANYTLGRDGVQCGELNTQYSYVFIDGHEFLGVDDDLIRHLLDAAWSLPENENNDAQPGDTLAETAARVAGLERIDVAEQDKRNSAHPGYCTKCHTYCYGDCTAN